MRRRTLVIALAAAALFGALVVPASAELHRVNVTLVTGEVRTMTIDVPPGQTVESIEIPGLPAPVQSVEDLGPVATPTPSPEATATPTVPPTAVTPTPTPAQEQPAPQQQQPQQQQSGGSQVPAPQPAAPSPTGGNTSHGKGGRIVGDDRAASDPNSERLTGALEDITAGAKKQVDGSNPTRNTDGSPTLDNPNVSSAGALGWMQFMPATWELYGVDGNHDGLKDPYNPVDAIFAAARYLKAAGADADLRAAIFAYNHADWYVDSVILRARYIGGLPADLVGSLSGLTQGRFPVQAKAAYAKEVKREDIEAAKEGQNPAYVVESDSQRKGIEVFARSGAPVVAVNDGRIVKVGESRKLGKYVVLQDVYGNTYTYAHLKDVVEKYPTPKPRKVDEDAVARELRLPARDAAPTDAASVTTESESKARKDSKTRAAAKSRRRSAQSSPALAKERLFANPDRPNAAAAGGEQQLYERSGNFGSYLDRVFGLDRSGVDMK